MSRIGIVSNDIVSKSRILDVLKDGGHDVVYIHSAANFDRQSFDKIIVDLDSPQAQLVLKAVPSKCLAFGSPNDEQKLKQARLLGCEKVYKHGEFFKKVLPNFSG